MNKVKISLLGLFFCLFFLQINHVFAQRNYAVNSVLANDNWYKIGIAKEGIYKIDVSFLNSLGISTTNLLSSSLKIFGNGGEMLSEKNDLSYIDDLQELAIEVFDGGDGFFNGNDYLLFYGASPHKWLKDSLNKRFVHQKNLYSDTSFYFLTIGTNGKRITTKNSTTLPNISVTSYNERVFYEYDLVNFLNSGKEWFGEEFSSLPGNSLSRNVSYNLLGIDVSFPLHITTNLACRSIGGASSFNIGVNNLQTTNVNMGQVSGFYLDAFATNFSSNMDVFVNSPTVSINMSFLPFNSSAQGWLNWFEIFARRNLQMNNQMQLFFRDWQSVSATNVANFLLNSTTSSTEIWDITNITQPQKMATNFNSNQTSFINTTERLREYVAFENASFLIPTFIEKINNQNLHNSSFVDYIIVTNSVFLNEAKRLAAFHLQQYGYKVLLTTTAEIFNEFGGGNADPSAIKNFVKMYFDKAAIDTTKRPKYLLLFGAASFDFKNRIANNTNFVPTFESANSTEPLLSYTTDDFYTFLKDEDDINLQSNTTKMAIAVGRLPVTSNIEAKIVVDKIINYHTSKSLGNWRNNAVFVADDKDNNLHLNDAEQISNNAFTVNNLINQKKIYLDAYPLVSGSGGSRYPQVNTEIVNQIYSGCLFFNYSGHGGYKQLADEAILSLDEANKFNNPQKLPLFITATCDFAPYDDPTKQSLGSNLLQGSANGAIGLITTTRVVFAYSNKVLNDNFLKYSLQKTNNKYATLGDALMNAKNYTATTLNDVVNIRKFVLLGDPAMQLAFPKLNISLTSINSNSNINDTLKALNKYNFVGKITDSNGNIQTDFSGTVFPIVYDKMQQYQTLGNDVASPITNFSEQQNIIYKGKATVTNGLFNFSFIVPKDINYQIGKGKLSLYADDGRIDANGMANSFYIGGSSNTNYLDNLPPTIQPYLNDEKFVNGGLTNANPLLIIKLFDSSGINTSGIGIGHDITAVLDGNEKNIIVLNNFYEAEKDNFQKGMVKYNLSNLSVGKHTLKIKAWDVANNSSEVLLEFTVSKQEKFEITNVINYPNPFSNETHFWFNHNQPNSQLKVLINIFSSSGKLVHQIQEQFFSEGNVVKEIFWNGKDRNSEKLAKGVYIYRIIVTNSANEKAEAIQKLYLL